MLETKKKKGWFLSLFARIARTRFPGVREATRPNSPPLCERVIQISYPPSSLVPYRLQQLQDKEKKSGSEPEAEALLAEGLCFSFNFSPQHQPQPDRCAWEFRVEMRYAPSPPFTRKHQ